MHDIMVKALPAGCRLTVRSTMNVVFMPFFLCMFFWGGGDNRLFSMYVQLFQVYFVEPVALTLLSSVLFAGMSLRNRAWCAQFFKFLSRNLNSDSLFLFFYLADLPYIVCCIPRFPKRNEAKRNETLTRNSL